MPIEYITPTIDPLPKQRLAWDALKHNDRVKYVVFGGGVGGGKSWLICEWLLTNCYFYPRSKWFIGREELKRLKQSTYQTWIKVCAFHNIPREDWRLNSQDSYIEFNNPQSMAFGSKIDLLDVSFKPSDPLYERFGSTEYTGGALEEAGEINHGAFDILKSRVGRHMNREYNIKSKILITCNPKKNWLYSMVYKPWKEKLLPPEYCFIQSLFGDNKWTAEEYEDNLKQLKDPATKERLMYGNWEYDDDPAKMIEYEAICEMFKIKAAKDDWYITCDVARLGKDKTVIMLWEGFQVVKVLTESKTRLNVLDDFLFDLCSEYGIPRSQVIVDEDGVGGGLVDSFRCKGFVNNSRAIQPIGMPKDNKNKDGHLKVNYANIKSQCADMLAKKVMNGEIGFNSTQHEEEIKEELEILKRKDIDKETKFQVIAKDDMKELIGRSPDFLDAMIMRMYFELQDIREKPKTRYHAPRFNELTGRAIN